MRNLIVLALLCGAYPMWAQTKPAPKPGCWVAAGKSCRIETKQMCEADGCTWGIEPKTPTVKQETPWMPEIKSIGLSIPLGNSYAEISAQGARVVRITGDEYADLQKLRQAVSAKEVEIAKAHGVDFEVTCDPLPNGTDVVIWIPSHQNPCAAKNPDRYEFRGQFLLINVPTGKDAAK